MSHKNFAHSVQKFIYIYIQCLALLYRLPSFDLDCLDERGVAQIIDNLTGI